MKKVLPVIVISQFLCTSIWFAGNAVLSDLILEHNLGISLLANLTSSVQFGFIVGTLSFAVLTISDRFSPSKVFFCCSIIAGLFNLGMSLNDIDYFELLSFRFFTGFFLAGIYPVGMKIASDYYQKGLGKSLGFLVGALVVGTAFPHLLKSLTIILEWKYVVYSTSILSFIGGLCILVFVADGPFHKKSHGINFTALFSGFRNRNFRSAAFGYFGHMWELYTFWAFVPIILTTYNSYNLNTMLNVPLLSFIIIGSGGLACACSGLLSQLYGARNIASIALMLSCLCCLSSPLFLFNSSSIVFLIFLIIWGLTVVADSPLFSTLVAQSAPEESRGTSLTFVNCIGFSITILSIQFLKAFSENINPRYIYLLLAIGPILGLFALLRSKAKK